MDDSLVELGSIKPYERNPRLNDAAVDAVAKSLQEFGFWQPIVVDAEGVIVCGRTRWKAAAKLGLARVPVHVARARPSSCGPTASPTTRRRRLPSGRLASSCSTTKRVTERIPATTAVCSLAGGSRPCFHPGKCRRVGGYTGW